MNILSSIDSRNSQSLLYSCLNELKNYLCSSIPWHLYDRVALEILKAISDYINKSENDYNEKLMSEVNIAVNLTRVIVHPNLKKIELNAWPKIMRDTLYDSLIDMTGLEVLDLGSGSVGWTTSNTERIILISTSRMNNLISFTLCFDCTDNIIASLSQNCPKLQKLDVTASRSVTDKSISYLLKCSLLTEINLLSTSVTPPGYANLLLNHKCLENIGRYDELGIAFEYIQNNWPYNNINRTFKLRAFECRNVSQNQLHLISEMCPRIASICIMKHNRINDLSIISAFTDLRELKLLSCDFYDNRLKKLLEVIGCNIASLQLEHVGELDLSALIYISQYCPNLQTLTFYNCEFSSFTRERFTKLEVPPFKHLERLKCVADCAETHLEFILSHSVNVKSIHLGSSTGIHDSTLKRIFVANQMKKLEELKILYSTDLSMGAVHLLMQNCENLRRLSELESWDGVSPQELKAFRERISINNMELDTSPTLSLA